MKLILQVAAGTVVAWVVIKATELMMVAGVANSASASLPQLPPVTSLEPRPTSRELPRVVIQQPNAAAPPSDTRQWSIQTPSGKTYSGTGRPPDGGLAQAKARDDQAKSPRGLDSPRPIGL